MLRGRHNILFIVRWYSLDQSNNVFVSLILIQWNKILYYLLTQIFWIKVVRWEKFSDQHITVIIKVFVTLIIQALSISDSLLLLRAWIVLSHLFCLMRLHIYDFLCKKNWQHKYGRRLCLLIWQLLHVFEMLIPFKGKGWQEVCFQWHFLIFCSFPIFHP